MARVVVDVMLKPEILDPQGRAVQGALGRLDPATGKTRQVPLGGGSRPHGVIVGADGLAWVTDSGLNAMVSVHPETLKVTRYPFLLQLSQMRDVIFIEFRHDLSTTVDSCYSLEQKCSLLEQVE